MPVSSGVVIFGESKMYNEVFNEPMFPVQQQRLEPLAIVERVYDLQDFEDSRE